MTGPLTGVATGIGSLPGSDPRAAAGMVVDALPELPHVPELPERGPWAQMAGRAAAVLVDLPVEWEGNAWRVAARAGRDVRRAKATLAEDLDAVEDRMQGYHGPAKLQICGPLTLAAVLELRSGTAAVSDPSAMRDLAASLAEGAMVHLGDVRRRVPDAQWVVQVDEPALSGVTAGSIPRASGWGTLAAVSTSEAQALLASVISAASREGAPVAVHSCSSDPDWDVLTGSLAGATGAISVDLSAIDIEAGALAMERWLDQGGAIWLGLSPVGDLPSELRPSWVDESWQRLQAFATTLGIAPERFHDLVALTPSCGLGGSLAVAAESYAGVSTMMRRLRGDGGADHDSRGDRDDRDDRGR